MGHISGLAIKPAKRAAMILVNRVGITVHGGIEGNWVDQDDPDSQARQITLISHNQWNKVEEDMNRAIPWETRRANARVMNLWFTQHDVDSSRRLQMGNSVIVQITGETTPCNLMNRFVPGLRSVLAPELRGGVTVRVLQGGVVSMYDSVRWLD